MANPVDALARIHQDREEIRRVVHTTTIRHAQGRRAVRELTESYEQLRMSVAPETKELLDRTLGRSVATAKIAFDEPEAA